MQFLATPQARSHGNHTVGLGKTLCPLGKGGVAFFATGGVENAETPVVPFGGTKKRQTFGVPSKPEACTISPFAGMTVAENCGFPARLTPGLKNLLHPPGSLFLIPGIIHEDGEQQSSRLVGQDCNAWFPFDQ